MWRDGKGPQAPAFLFAAPTPDAPGAADAAPIPADEYDDDEMDAFFDGGSDGGDSVVVDGPGVSP